MIEQKVSKENRIAFIEILRALAVILITNSHFKGVYPNDVFSFGGGFGLGLFYMISGYLLANIKEDTRFIKWYIPKILRLYVPLYIFHIFELLIGYKRVNSVHTFLKEFIFPGTWFGGSMVIFYAVYYICVKYYFKGNVRRKVGSLLAILGSCYSILFIAKFRIATFSLSTLSIEETFCIETPYFITQFIWLSCMFIGYWIRKERFEAKKERILLCIAGVSILVFLGIKLITRNGQYVNSEFLLGIVYWGFALSVFLYLAKKETWCNKFSKTFIGKITRSISTCSLEIYYVQFMWIKLLRDIVFPVNLILLFVSIVISAYIVHWLTKNITKKISFVKV